MKIRAIRVAEFARFREPVALEGLSGGLDLLIGPNEAGKSTLFRALELALFTSHRTASAVVADRYRPYGGGAPLVEVEVELGGEPWRVRKRFVTQKSAEMVSLTAGTITRGAEAETLLERLLSAEGAAAGHQLLWLRQGALLEDQSSLGEYTSVVRSAVEREIATAAGGEALRSVQVRLQKDLDQLVTRSRGQPTGRYDQTIKTAARLTVELQQAREKKARQQHLLDRAAACAGELAALQNPVEEASRKTRHASAVEQQEAADQALREASSARATLAEARTARDAAVGRVENLDKGLAQLGRLDTMESADAAEREAVGQRLAETGTELQAATEAQSTARGEVERIETELRRSASIARWRDLDARLARSRAAEAREADAHERLKGLPLDERPVREARQLGARIAAARAHLEAASAAVTVRYLPGATARIGMAGREIDDAERILASRRLVLEIPGIGTMEIEPGASRDRDQIEADLSRHTTALASLLANAGAEDVADLEARHERARSFSAEAESARTELRAHAPDGLARLEADLAQAGAALDGDAPPTEARPATTGLDEAMHNARSEARAADERQRTLATTMEALRLQAATLDARRSEREHRRAELARALPPPEQRGQSLADARADAERQNRSYDDALRLERLAAARAPDEQALRRLKQEVAEAQAAIKMAETRASAVVLDQTRIEAELEAVLRDDIEMRIATLENELEQAETERDRLTSDVNALQLLSTELSTEQARLRDTYLFPVLERLEPYLHEVFPEASLILGGDYAVEALRRGANEESLARLSEGTREQLAVLVRFAFARLLAEKGTALPVVLDDALVYADDRRIARMHRALEQSANFHQVIVLSCREHAFEGIRANRVEIVPWQPDRR